MTVLKYIIYISNYYGDIVKKYFNQINVIIRHITMQCRSSVNISVLQPTLR